MTEFLSRIDPPFMIPLLAIFMGCLTGMVATVATNWQKVRKAELAAALKQEMIQRGMSAEDIKQVLGAPLVTSPRGGCCPVEKDA